MEGTRTGSTRVERNNRHREWINTFFTVIGAFAIWCLVTAFYMQPFKIPSGSMENTLHVGDRILVQKHDAQDVPNTITRGDVVVFEDHLGWEDGEATQSNPLTRAFTWTMSELKVMSSDRHLVKRVIGIPGDKIQCRSGGLLTVNGIGIHEPYLKTGVSPCDNDFSITVPPHKLWVMGDNRSNSADSRAFDDGTGKLGSIAISSLTGKCDYVVLPHMSRCGNDEKAFSSVK